MKENERAPKHPHNREKIIVLIDSLLDQLDEPELMKAYAFLRRLRKGKVK